MKPFTRSRLAFLAGLFLLGLAAVLPWLLSMRPSEAERRLAEALAWMEAHPPKYSDRSADEAQRAARHRAAVDLAAQRWYEELLEQYPDYQVGFREVADEQNGFLGMLELVESLDGGNLLPPELTEMLGGRSPWDPAAFEDWLASNGELFERLLALAERPDRSVKGIAIPRYSFLHARPAKQMSDLFLAAARVAIERGDAGSAYRYHAASMNLAAHYDGIELPSLLAKTVAILVRLNAADSFQEHVLPHVADDPAQLARWRAMLAHQDSRDTEVPRLMIGEWNMVVRDLLLPAIVAGKQSWQTGFGGDTEPYHLPDPAETIAAYTEDNRAIQAWGIGEAAEAPSYGPESFSQLSEEGRATMSLLVIGAHAWFRGMDRANSRLALNDALLAIALGEEPAPDPVTGEPFLWDPETRTLSTPAGVSDIDPVTLP